MSTELARDLRKLNKVWQQTEAKAPGGSNIPDGEYVGELVSMVVGHSKKGNRLQVAEQWKISYGKFKGDLATQYHGIETDQNIAYFKGHAEVLGIELPDDFEELPDALEAFVDANQDMFKLRLKTNEGGFQNVNVMSVADDTTSSDAESVAEDSDEFGEHPVKKTVVRTAKTRK